MKVVISRMWWGAVVLLLSTVEVRTASALGFASADVVVVAGKTKEKPLPGGLKLCSTEITETATGASAQRQRYVLPTGKPWVLFSRVANRCLSSKTSTSSILASDGANLFRLLEPLSQSELQTDLSWWVDGDAVDAMLRVDPGEAPRWSVFGWLEKMVGAQRLTSFKQVGERGVWTAMLGCDAVTHMVTYTAGQCETSLNRSGAAWEIGDGNHVVANRATAAVNANVVKVQVLQKGTTVLPCTGLLIAPGFVLTAGHCAPADEDCTPSGQDTDCSSFSVDVPRSGGGTVSVPVLRSFTKAPVDRVGLEYAWLELFPSPPLAVSRLILASSAGLSLPRLGARRAAAVSGFPHGNALSEFSDCEVFFSTDKLLYHTCNNLAGMSGGPLWVTTAAGANDANVQIPLGIHTAPGSLSCGGPGDLKWWSDIPQNVRLGLGQNECGDRRCIGVAVKLRAVYADYCGALNGLELLKSAACSGLLKFMPSEDTELKE